MAGIEFTSGTEELKTVSDGSSLIGVEDLGSIAPEGLGANADVFPNGIVPSEEGFRDKLKSGQLMGEAQGEYTVEGKHKPLCSKVIDANGNARIVILYDGCQCTGGGDTAMFVNLIDSANANDVVDITIMVSVLNFANGGGTSIWKSIAMLSALKRCKAKIITRAGALCSLIECALWLSGHERHLAPAGAGLVLCKQPMACFSGSADDMASEVKNLRLIYSDVIDFVVEKGLLTHEEIESMFENNGVASLYGDKLQERLESLKS